jgi:hypothetical protein
MTNGTRNERDRQTEATNLLICVAFLLLCGENLDSGTKSPPLPNPRLPFLPNRPTYMAAPPPPTPSLCTRQALSLPSGAAVKGGKNRGGASVGGGAIRGSTLLGGKQRQAALVLGSRGGPCAPAPSPARRGRAQRKVSRLDLRQFDCSLIAAMECRAAASLSRILVSLSADVVVGRTEVPQTRGQGCEQGR